MKSSLPKQLGLFLFFTAVCLLPLAAANPAGAAECCGTNALFVSPTGSDANDGTSWNTAKRHINSAINALYNRGGTIYVAAGEYAENVNLLSDITLLGGFTPNTNTRTPYASIINGGGNSAAVKATNIRNGALDGFTITGGSHDNGGGLFVQGGSFTISRNLIKNNTASWSGGGVYLAGYSGVFSRNIVQNNHAPVGAGAYCSDLRAESLIKNCRFEGNAATNTGGGVYISSSSGTIHDNTFQFNSVTKGPGGGGYIGSFSGEFSNNLLHHNTARVGAGLYTADISTAGILLNCTIADNTSSGAGGGIFASNYKGQLKNTIIWGNSQHQIYSDGALEGVSYSTIQNGYIGPHNSDTDPLLTADYTLEAGSEAINSGSDSSNRGHTGGSISPANQPPAAICSGDITIDIANQQQEFCDGAQVQLNGCASTDPDRDALTYTWNWGSETLYGACPTVFFGLGAHTVTLTVGDGEFQSSCTFNVNVICTAQCSIQILSPASGTCVTQPVVTVTGKVGAGIPCEVFVAGIETTTDSEGNFSVNVPLNDGEGIYDIAAAATVCNTSCGDEITITYDVSAPAMACPDNVTLEQESAAGTPASALPPGFAATATDNVDGELVPTDNIPQTLPGGSTTISFSAEDSCGNSASCNTAVEVLDTTPPQFTAYCQDITAEQTVPAGIPADSATLNSFFNVAATDTVDASVDISHDAPAVFPAGGTAVAFTASDDSGNSSTMTCTVTVQDTTPPEFAVPCQNYSLECEGPEGVPSDSPQLTGFFDVIASDTVDGTTYVNNDAPAVFPIGQTVVTFSTSDNAGNQASCTANVSVSDTTAASITCPADVVLECEGNDGTPSASLPAEFAATAADTCDQSVAISNDIPVVFNKGTNTVTFTASDDAGNSSSCTANVVVVDTTAPGISCPDDITVECEGTSGVPASSEQLAAFLSPQGTDVCDDSVTITHDAPDYFAPNSTTDVTFTVTDDAGNSGACTAAVTVQDTTPPNLQCPGNIVINSPVGLDPTLFEATCSDNCCGGCETLTSDLSSLLLNENPPVLPVGENVITFTASDCNGNTTSCSATITVLTGKAPNIYCPGDIQVEQEGCDGTPFASLPPSFNATAQSGNLPANSSANAQNKQQSDPLEVTSDAPAVLPPGTTEITFTAKDTSPPYLESSCTARATVADTVKPVITCPGDTQTTAACGESEVTLSLEASASDLCEITPQSDAPAAYPIGATTVTFTAADSAGNSSSCSTTVTVLDGCEHTVTNVSINEEPESGSDSGSGADESSGSDGSSGSSSDSGSDGGSGSDGSSTSGSGSSPDSGSGGSDTGASGVDMTAVGAMGSTLVETTGSGTGSSSDSGTDGGGTSASPSSDTGSSSSGTTDTQSAGTTSAPSGGETTTGSGSGTADTSGGTTNEEPAQAPAVEVDPSSEDDNSGGTQSAGEAVEVTIVSPPDNVVVGTNTVIINYTVNGDNKSLVKELAEGANTITVSETGETGDVGSDSINITYDPNAQALSIVSPVDGTIVSSSPVKVTYILDGVAKSINKPLSEGKNTIVINETDKENNKLTALITITLDSTPPKVEIVSPENGVTLAASPITVKYKMDGISKTRSQALSEGLNIITIEETDLLNRSGKDSVAVYFKGSAPRVTVLSPANNATVSASPLTVTYSFDGELKSVVKELAEGPNTIEIVESDRFGRAGKAALTVTLDSKAPTVKITSPQNMATVTTSPLEVTYTADGKKEQKVLKELQEGINTVTISESNNSGKKAVTGSDAITVVLDTTPPAVKIISPENKSVLSASPATITYTTDGKIKTVAKDLQEGTNTVTVTESDSQGREGSDSITLTLDNSSPQIKILSPQDKSSVETSPVVVKYSADGVLKTIAWDLSAGENTITISETDAFGRSGSASIKIYLVSPKSDSLLACPQDVTVEQKTPRGTKLTLQAVASDPNVALSEIDSTAPEVFPPGTTTVTFTALTEEGETVSCNTNVTVKDSTAPMIDLLLNPKKTEYYNSDPLSIAYLVTDSADAAPRVKISVTKDNGPALDITADSPISLDLNNYVGDVTLTVSAVDNAGNRSSKKIAFKVVENPDSL